MPDDTEIVPDASGCLYRDNAKPVTPVETAAESPTPEPEPSLEAVPEPPVA